MLSGSILIWFSFLKNLCALLHVAVAGLPFHWQSRRVPFFSQFLQHLLFLQFWTVAVVNHVRICLIVVLICIPLIISDGELFSCASSCTAICVLWRKVFWSLLPIMWLDWVYIKLHDFINFGDGSLVALIVWKILYRSEGCLFIFFYSFLCYAKAFEFNYVPVDYF